MNSVSICRETRKDGLSRLAKHCEVGNLYDNYMGRWIEPRLIAISDEWYPNALHYDGPSCYELGSLGYRERYIRWHYVGETGNERRRIKGYATHGSHKADRIDEILAEGRKLYFHSYKCPTKEQAVMMQNKLLAIHNYPWNRMLNGDTW